MLRIPPKCLPRASKDPQREVGAVAPEAQPPLPAPRLPNDSLVLALGDLALVSAKQLMQRRAPFAGLGACTLKKEEEEKKNFFFNKAALGRFFSLSFFLFKKF